jgi:hypothetical protein
MADVINPPAAVRAVEDLKALAKRVREREAKSRADQLAHAKEQAADVYAARQACTRRGEWKAWYEEAELSRTRAWCYNELGKRSVTERFQRLSEDAQWLEWQQISGNAPAADEDEDEAEEEAPKPPGPDVRTITVRMIRQPPETVSAHFRAVHPEPVSMPPRVPMYPQTHGPDAEGAEPAGEAREAFQPVPLQAEAAAEFRRMLTGLQTVQWDEMKVLGDIVEEGGDPVAARGWRWLAENRKWPSRMPGRGFYWGIGSYTSCLPAGAHYGLPKEHSEDHDLTFEKALEYAAAAVGAWLQRQEKAS